MNFGKDYDRRYNTNAENSGQRGRTQGYDGADRGYSNYGGGYNGNAGRGYSNYDDRYNGRVNRGDPNRGSGRSGSLPQGEPGRRNENRGRVAVMPPPPTYINKPSGGRVVISTKALVALVCLIIFLFVSFLIVAFLPADDDKSGENMGASAESGQVSDGGGVLDEPDVGAQAGGDGQKPDEDKFIICIDPGHGYDDIGTSYKYLGNETEKDINLKVALLVVKNLKDMGYEVMMTRDSDTPPSDLEPNGNGDRVINPAWRCDFANSNKVDLFVSLHCNSYESDERVNGTRLYYFAESKYDSAKLGNTLAKFIQNGLSVEKPSVTGLGETEAYAVTKKAEAPSVLIEMGFATNKTDAENLINENWQQSMAKAVSDGIASYIEEKNTGK